MDSLEIPVPLWRHLLHELRTHGRGARESGAFLLAKVGAHAVGRVICYNVLDPSALDTGIIIFQGSGFVPLWKICLQEHLRVVADVHTHPGSWTGQGSADATHPMISQPGHLALIVPSYAQNKRQGLRGVGIFEYQGQHKWKTWRDYSGRVRLTRTKEVPHE